MAEPAHSKPRYGRKSGDRGMSRDHDVAELPAEMHATIEPLHLANM